MGIPSQRYMFWRKSLPSLSSCAGKGHSISGQNIDTISLFPFLSCWHNFFWVKIHRYILMCNFNLTCTFIYVFSHSSACIYLIVLNYLLLERNIETCLPALSSPISQWRGLPCAFLSVHTYKLLVDFLLLRLASHWCHQGNLLLSEVWWSIFMLEIHRSMCAFCLVPICLGYLLRFKMFFLFYDSKCSSSSSGNEQTGIPDTKKDILEASVANGRSRLHWFCCSFAWSKPKEATFSLGGTEASLVVIPLWTHICLNRLKVRDRTLWRLCARGFGVLLD